MSSEVSKPTELHKGKDVKVIMHLNMKGTSNTNKRGIMVKNISLKDNNDQIKDKTNKVQMVFKTCFKKKV